MKKGSIFKKIALLSIIFSVFFTINTVSAETAPDTVTIDKSKTSDAEEHGGDWLSYIKDSDGTWVDSINIPEQYVIVNGTSRAAYCMEKDGTPYQTNAWVEDAYTLNRISQQTGAAYIYLLENGTASKLGLTDSQAYYVTQVALWWYQDLANGIPDNQDGNLPASFKIASQETKNYTDEYNLYPKIKKLVTDARSATSSQLTLTLTGSNTMNYSADRTKFTSSITINTNGTVSSVQISSKSGFTDETDVLSRSGNNITLTLPISKINALSGRITVTASATKEITTAYLYKTSATKPEGKGEYQHLLVPIKSTRSTGAGTSVSFRRTLVKVTKVDENNKPLSNAKLRLTDSKGKSIEWVTDQNVKEIYDLTPGLVTLEELEAPDGYVVMAKKTATLKEDEVLTITARNSKFNIRVVKKDDSGNILPGAVMRFSCDTSKFDYQFTTTGEYTIINDNDGKGHYIVAGETCTLQEIKAPSGYVLNTEKISKKINNTSTADANTFEMINNQNEIEISKQDATTGKELPGAHLVLKNTVTGKIIDEWDSTDEVHVVKGLEDGVYSLSETIAPSGYAKVTTAVIFEVKDGKVDQPVVMLNEPTTVIIEKKEKDTDKFLSGAELVVKDSSGKELYRWRSTDESHTITGLKVGETYTLEEVTAPEGYDKAKSVIFKVKDTSEIQVVTMYDELTIVPVPDTGSFTSMMIYGTGAFVLTVGICGTYLYLRKRKSERF